MTIRLLAGDCRSVLPTLAADSVHCVVTSPPYYGLRDYGTALWEGGDAACDHASAKIKGRADYPFGPASQVQTSNVSAGYSTYRPECACGAVRIDRQIGLEATPDEYLATMVAVFREVRRVLRPDGTCWVNLGDSMSSGGNGPGSGKQLTNVGANMPPKRTDGLAAKQLLLMPARLALALQADGWWVRSDIIWHKPNPMPESCTDRPTSAHEHVFLLTKSARYFYDADAVREAHNDVNRPEGFKGRDGIGRPYENQGWAGNAVSVTQHRDYNPAGRSCRNVWTIATSPFSEWTETSRRVCVAWDAAVDGKKRKASPDCPVHGDRPVQAPNARDDGHAADPDGRTARTDADRAQEPIDDYAPIETRHGLLIVPSTLDLLGQPNLRAAMPRSSQSHRTARDPATSQPCSASAQTGDGTGYTSASPSPSGSAERTPESSSALDGLGDGRSSQTVPHSVDKSHGSLASSSASDPSSCTCEWYIEKTEKTSHFATFPPALVERCIKAGCPVGGTVLDPFGGAGTVALVADRLQRNAILIELNVAYTEMAMERCRADAPLFTSFPPAEPPEDERMADLFADAAE